MSQGAVSLRHAEFRISITLLTYSSPLSKGFTFSLSFIISSIHLSLSQIQIAVFFLFVLFLTALFYLVFRIHSLISSKSTGNSILIFKHVNTHLCKLENKILYFPVLNAGIERINIYILVRKHTCHYQVCKFFSLV